MTLALAQSAVIALLAGYALVLRRGRRRDRAASMAQHKRAMAAYAASRKRAAGSAPWQ